MSKTHPLAPTPHPHYDVRTHECDHDQRSDYVRHVGRTSKLLSGSLHAKAGKPNKLYYASGVSCFAAIVSHPHDRPGAPLSKSARGFSLPLSAK